MSKMPKVDVNKVFEKLNNDNREYPEVDAAEETKILNIVVKKNGEIRATKPKVTDDNHVTGKAAYVWRMVCFMVSPHRVHHCIPATAHFDLPAYLESGYEPNKWSSALAREMANPLEAVIDAIVDSVDKTEWHGVHRWGRVL